MGTPQGGGADLAQADPRDLVFAHKIGQALHGFLNIAALFDAMHIIQIDLLDPQPPQGRLAGAARIGGRIVQAAIIFARLADDAKVFLAVTRAGTLSAAADQMAIGVATLSPRIERLEDALGLPLFVRQQSGYVLTEDGTALIPAAEAMNVTLQRLGVLGYGLYGAPDYLERHSASADAAPHDRHAFVAWGEAQAHLPAAEWVERILQGHAPAVTTTSLATQVAAVRAGLGLATLPHFLAAEAGLICIDRDLGLDQPIYLVLQSDLAQAAIRPIHA